MVIAASGAGDCNALRRRCRLACNVAADPLQRIGGLRLERGQP